MLEMHVKGVKYFIKSITWKQKKPSKAKITSVVISIWIDSIKHDLNSIKWWVFQWVVNAKVQMCSMGSVSVFPPDAWLRVYKYTEEDSYDVYLLFFFSLVFISPFFCSLHLTSTILGTSQKIAFFTMSINN